MRKANGQLARLVSTRGTLEWPVGVYEFDDCSHTRDVAARHWGTLAETRKLHCYRCDTEMEVSENPLLVELT